MTSDWEVIESVTEYENPYFAVERESVAHPTAGSKTYYHIEFEGDGGVIALGVDDGDVLFVELYRPRLDETVLELPGGGIEKDETVEEAACREFTEETGLKPSDSHHLGSFYFSAWTRAQRDVVWVDDFESVDTEPEAEIQRLRRVPVEEALGRACEDPAVEWNLTPLIIAHKEGLIDRLYPSE